jgi:glycosyltransferase involved in cell wall biosynthesis
MPLISVIMPMRNAERFVRASAESVLAQRDVELELVVVDDGSMDRSAEIVRAIGDDRIRIIDGPKRGISAAFNAGLAAARGEFVARCDSDDFYRPGRLSRQIYWLESHPDFSAVGAGYAYLDARGRYGVERVVRDGKDDVTDELLAGIGRSHMCAYLFRADALRAVGGCREWFVTSEDADLQYRLAERGRIGYDAFDAYGYRLHDTSITHTSARAKKQWYADMAQRFRRQRVATGFDELIRGTPPTFCESATTADGSESGADELADWMTSAAWDHHLAGERFAAVKIGWRGVRLRPMSLRMWKNLLLLSIKSRPRTT